MRADGPRSAQLPSLRMWVASSLFLTAVGFALQFGVIPYLMASLHGVDGVVANTDSVTFHHAAVRLATAIDTAGWHEWQLRPNAWGHVGLSSAIYALTTPKPWVLVPAAAALMAGAFVMLAHVLRLVGLSTRVAVGATLVLLVLPSTAMLTAQWHKDQIAIPSTLAMILGFLLVWHGERVLAGTVAILAGAFGLWLVRDHIIEVMAGAVLVGTLAAAPFVRWSFRGEARGLVRVLIGAIGAAVLSHALPSWTDRLEVSQAQWQEWEGTSKPEEPDRHADLQKGRDTGASQTSLPREDTGPGAAKAASPDDTWHRSTWIPSQIDRRFASLAQLREASKRGTGHGCTSIDTDVSFTSAESLLAYTPRAAALVLFAPFPRMWLGSACSGGGRVLPLISGAEMTIAYAAYLGIPLLLWQCRRQARVWFVVVLCLSAVTIHGLIFVNAGTIFRIRGAWFETLVVLGVAGWAMRWSGRREFGSAGRRSVQI